jgi:hypothetical protein
VLREQARVPALLERAQRLREPPVQQRGALLRAPLRGRALLREPLLREQALLREERVAPERTLRKVGSPRMSPR